MVPLDFSWNLLAPDERRPEEDESVGGAGDVRRISFLPMGGTCVRGCGGWGGGG
jgi:hypothetical protein